jgi:hypothetical protein
MKAFRLLLPAFALGVTHAAASEPEGEQLILANGLRVSLVEVAGATTFALTGRIDAGSIYDPKDHPGLSAVAAQWLASPVIGESALSPTIDWSLEPELRVPVSNRWLEFRAIGHAGDEGPLLSALEGRLAFVARAAARGVSPQRWGVLREAAAARARAILTRVEGQLEARALETLFAAGSPFSRPPWGPPDGAVGDPEDLQAFLRDHVTPARTRLVLAGNLDTEHLRSRLAQGLGHLPSPEASAAASPAAEVTLPQEWSPRRVVWPQMIRDQAIVILPAAPTQPAEASAIRALAHLLGTSWNSGRLARRLEGLDRSLMVRAGLTESVVPGFLYVRVASAPSRTGSVLAAVRAILDELAHGQLTADDVEAFADRERAAQSSRDPAGCAERALLERPSCGAAPPRLALGEVRACAERLFARPPLVVVLGPANESRP